MKKLDVITAFLVIAGAINWGLVGVFDFNLVEFLFGGIYIDRVVYVLVGISGVYEAVSFKGIQERWGKKSQPKGKAKRK